MNKKFGVTWLVVALIVGLLLGAAGGGLLVTMRVIRYETDAIITAVAENTFSIVPVILALNTENEEERLERFESTARTQLTGGVVVLHSSLPMLSEDKRERMVGILRSISRIREKLSIGRFDSPPRDHIEEILAAYSE